MASASRPLWARYGVAVLSVAIAVALRWLLTPLVGTSYPSGTVLFAVVFSAWYGGFGPTITAALLSIGLAIVVNALGGGGGGGGARGGQPLVAYAILSLGIALLGGSMARARLRISRTADEASRQREQLRATLASIGDGVIVTDAAGRITSLNAVAEKLTGWNAGEAAGRLIEEVFCIVGEESEQAIENPAERALREGTVVGLANHTALLARDGRRIDIDDTAAPIRNPEGQVVGVVLVFRDITDRKRAEQTARFLAEASEALASLVDLESTLDKVARLAVPYFADWCLVDLLDGEGKLRRMATAHRDPAKVELAREICTRWPPRKGNPTAPLSVVKTGASEIIPEIRDEMLTRSVHDEELLRRLRQLGLRSYLAVPLTVRGKLIGVVSFLTAESARRYTPADLAAASDLARRAAIAIENAQLYQAAREADRRKDEFLATLAHELRNPLAPISNALEILKLPGVDPATKANVRDVAQRQLTHMTRLVDDLLDVSRIMRGKTQLRLEPLELRTIVARAVETVQPLLAAERHELTVSLPVEPIWLNADAVRLTQVVGNLLSNAAKYTEPGGKIALSAALEAGQLVLRVRDSGIGISPDMLPRVFDMFMQAAPGERRSQGGLGIGLTLVKNLVEMHGGTVEAHSAGLDQGSEFVVRLPMIAGPTVTQPSTANSPAAIAPQRVLVVDDNVDAASSLGVLLRLHGHQVELAFGGADAIQTAIAHPPNLVFLDIGMPGMSGYDVAQRLRAEFASSIRLVALTGWGAPADQRRSQEAGFDRHLTKPVELAAVESVIRELCGPAADGAAEKRREDTPAAVNNYV